MAEPELSFAGLLRQLRAEAKLTQEELAEAAGVSPRSVSDLERGVTHAAHKDTAVLLAGALGLPGPARELFVAAARGKAPAAEVLAARQEGVPGAFAAVATRALPATAFMTRSKPPLAGALGVVSATLLPVWAVASPVRVASLAFTGIASVPGAGTGVRVLFGRVMCGLGGPAGCCPVGQCGWFHCRWR